MMFASKVSQHGQEFDFIDWYRAKNGNEFPDYINIIDIGANDGKTFSNSFVFENSHNKILCIEPNMAIYRDLVEKRPQSLCVNYACDNQNRIVSFLPTLQNAKRIENLAIIKRDDLLGQINDCNSNPDDIKKSYDISSRTLYSLLEEVDFPERIDFLSIDTEGSEYNILWKFFDEIHSEERSRAKRYSIKFICVETNDNIPLKKKIYDLMIENNYRLLTINFNDDYYELI